MSRLQLREEGKLPTVEALRGYAQPRDNAVCNYATEEGIKKATHAELNNLLSNLGCPEARQDDDVEHKRKLCLTWLAICQKKKHVQREKWKTELSDCQEAMKKLDWILTVALEQVSDLNHSIRSLVKEEKELKENIEKVILHHVAPTPLG